MKSLTVIFGIVSLFTSATKAAPTEPSSLAGSSQESQQGSYCGKCVLAGTGRLRELRTSVPSNKCNTLPEGEQYGSCGNSYCGLCMTFKDKDCQGDMTYAGGAGAGSFDAKGARSYFCI